MRRIVDTDPRSMGDLFKDLKDEARYLFRRELDLAKTEMTAKGREIGKDSSYIAAGAVVGLLAGFTLCLALSFALIALFDAVMPLAVAVWLGPLVVAAALGLVAWVMVRAGMKRLQRQRLQPEQTTATLQENQRWLQEKFT